MFGKVFGRWKSLNPADFLSDFGCSPSEESSEFTSGVFLVQPQLSHKNLKQFPKNMH